MSEKNSDPGVPKDDTGTPNDGKSTPNGKGTPEKGDPKPQNPDNSSKTIEQLQNDLKALQGIQSAKDNEITKLKDQLAQTQESVKKINDQAAVRDLIIRSEYPKELKDELSKSIDALTPENFEAEAKKLHSIFELGQQSVKSKFGETISDDPDPAKVEEQTTAIKSAKSFEELNAALKRKK